MRLNTKRIALVAALLLIGISIWYLESQRPPRTSGEEVEVPLPPTSDRVEEKLRLYPRAKEIVRPAGFINTGEISISQFIGEKVILIDFWTYSCINCLRTTPYLNSWWEKYRDQGLLIIGLHTPEFEFEKDYENVLAAVRNLGIEYPVVLDNDYATWDAYNNLYWPRKYLIDIDGFIIYDHIGEGAYEETERKIQEALEERRQVLGLEGEIAEEIVSPEDAPQVDFSRIKSPEIYFGAGRNIFLGNGVSRVQGVQTLPETAQIELNVLYLVGQWEFQREFAENRTSGAKVIFRYQARDVFIVAESEEGVRLTILRDGQPLGAEAGEDAAKDGSSTVFIKESRLYKLIQDSDYGEHTLEIVVEDPGLRAFTFTFG